MKTFSLANALAQMTNDSFVSGVHASQLGHGMITLANEDMVTQAAMLQDMTAFAIGYDQPSNKLVQLRDYLVPRRSSSSRYLRLKVYDEHEAWETVDYKRTKRQILGEFQEVAQRKLTHTTKLVQNRGLSITLDRDQIKDQPDWQQVHTRFLTDLLIRATIQEAIALYTTSATADTWTWNKDASPDLDVRSAGITLANATGFRPNRVAMGDAAELKRLGAYEDKNTPGGYARMEMTSEQQLATAMGVDQALVGTERYNSTANAKQEFLGGKVLLFTAVEAETPFDPSNIVRHVTSASFGGGDYAVYQTEVGVKKIVLTVENYELLSVQHTSGLLLATIN